MIDSIEQIEKIFIEIDNKINKKIKVYAIGGVALLDQGLKVATKDIDLIVETEEEFNGIQKALENIGFKQKIPGDGYSHFNLSQIFIRDEYRVDIFKKQVCSKFSLSKNMIGRARRKIKLNYVDVLFCSNEDIFLFKTMTEREGDLSDCEGIVRAAVDWDIILDELKKQISSSGQDLWITWVGERFDLLEERGIAIPIMDEINKLRIKFYNDLEKKFLEKK